MRAFITTRFSTGLLGGLLTILAAAGSSQAQVRISAAGDDHVSIEINGQKFSDFYIGRTYTKPYLAPLRAATGQIVTRSYPMERVEGESRDHPHHKGLWIGFGDINGVNFWETEPQSHPSPENPKGKGKIELVKVDSLKSGNKSGSIQATFAWNTPEGATLIDETRTLTFFADEKIRRVDIDAAFHARTAIQFADTKEGFFAIRVADSMTGKHNGVITNSEGAHTEKDVWGKRADWADYVGAVNGQQLGILILDHPQNPRHPPRWHARDYGLFADNPFGVKAFDPQATEGPFRMAAGDRARFRYRVIIHAGDISKKQMADWYKEYGHSNK